jgi:hypothetical protein
MLRFADAGKGLFLILQLNLSISPEAKLGLPEHVEEWSRES